MDIKRIERHLKKMWKINNDLKYEILNEKSRDSKQGYLIGIYFWGYREFWSADIKKVSDIDNLIK